MNRLASLARVTRTWYTANALGSGCATLSDAGVVGGAAFYDPYGQVQSGTLGTFGFTGELQQGSDVYLRARGYYASAGGFGSRDARWGDQSLLSVGNTMDNVGHVHVQYDRQAHQHHWGKQCRIRH